MKAFKVGWVKVQRVKRLVLEAVVKDGRWQEMGLRRFLGRSYSP